MQRIAKNLTEFFQSSITKIFHQIEFGLTKVQILLKISKSIAMPKKNIYSTMAEIKAAFAKRRTHNHQEIFHTIFAMTRKQILSHKGSIHLNAYFNNGFFDNFVTEKWREFQFIFVRANNYRNIESEGKK